jgi:hypothetical protein
MRSVIQPAGMANTPKIAPIIANVLATDTTPKDFTVCISVLLLFSDDRLAG